MKTAKTGPQRLLEVIEKLAQRNGVAVVPSLSRLALMTQASERSVWRWLHSLKTEGLIEITPVRQQGRHTVEIRVVKKEEEQC